MSIHETRVTWSEVADLEARLIEILLKAGKKNVKSVRFKFVKRKDGLDVLFSFAVCQDCEMTYAHKAVQCDILPTNPDVPVTYSIGFGPAAKLGCMDNAIQVGGPQLDKT